MAQIRVEKLSKEYGLASGGKVAALKGLDLAVGEGEWVVLVGPSGSGKTTTLRVIAGLEQPTSGRVWIGGRPAEEIPARERNLALVFQNGALYPHLSAYENLAFGLRIRRVPRGEIEQRVKGAAELLRIEECLERKPGELSSGQRQRVALGRALVRRPEAFLLDEPLASLDPPTRALMREELMVLRKKAGGTTVLVTHDQYEAMTLGDRLGVLREGMLQQVGPAAELYASPVNLFVGQFLGWPPMNCLAGTVQQSGGRAVVRLELGLETGTSLGEAVPLRYSGSERGETLEGRRVVIGIRPEDLALGQGGAGAGLEIEGAVEAVENPGSVKYLHVNVRGTRVIAHVGSDCGVRAGETVKLGVRKVHVFEQESGKRMACEY